MQDRFERTVNLPDGLKSSPTREQQRKINRDKAFDNYLKASTQYG
jgi:hypothetical protein